MLTEKDYYDTDHVSIRRLSYWNIVPCFIIHKDEPMDKWKGWGIHKDEPMDKWKGWGIHIGILCFGIDFNW